MLSNRTIRILSEPCAIDGKLDFQRRLHRNCKPIELYWINGTSKWKCWPLLQKKETNFWTTWSSKDFWKVKSETNHFKPDFLFHMLTLNSRFFMVCFSKYFGLFCIWFSSSILQTFNLSSSDRRKKKRMKDFEWWFIFIFKIIRNVKFLQLNNRLWLVFLVKNYSQVTK